MKTLLSALTEHAHAKPDATAFLVRRNGEWTDLTWRRLELEMNFWADTFLRHGLKQGGVVFIVLKHCSDLYPTFLGAMRAGLVPSFLPYPTAKQDPLLYWESHRELFARVQPCCVLTYGDNIGEMRAAISEADCLILDVADQLPIDDTSATDRLPSLSSVERHEAVAMLQHSSGTTGLKKGVALTFGQIRLQLAAYTQTVEAGPQDCIVSWLPLYHDMGLMTCFLLPVVLGIKVVSIDAFDWLARPDQLLILIDEFQATLCWLPNFAFNHLVRTRNRKRTYNLSSMRALINCSEPCKAETFERFRNSFQGEGLSSFALQNCYAMAEAVFAVTQTPLTERPVTLVIDLASLSRHGKISQVAREHPQATHYLSCGRAIEGIAIRIKAEFGRDAGEIEIAGQFVFDHYHQNPAETADAFSEGWYRTGDIGFLLDGNLYICGRTKEILIVHGRNYYANDVEMVVNQVDGIKPGRAVVFGLYDAATASEEAILLAEVAPEFEGDVSVLGQLVRTAVFDHLELTLKKVQILEPGKLVKTTSGKISRKENIKRYQQEILVVQELA